MVASSRVKVKFNREIDLAILPSSYFTLSESGSTAALGGSFSVFPDGVEFTSSSGLKPYTSYTYRVHQSVKDKSGVFLSSPYSASFTTGSSLTTSNAALEGAVKDSKGIVLASVPVRIFKPDYSFDTGGMTDFRGAFKFDIPAGSYLVEIYPPAGRNDLVRPESLKISLSINETRYLDLKFLAAVKTISGAVSFPDGRPVLDAEVGAYSQDTGQWSSALVDSQGKFILRVGPGIWKVGLRPKSSLDAKWSWSGSFSEVNFSDSSFEESRVLNFSVSSLVSSLIVKAVDQDGNFLAGAGVIVDTVSSSVLQSEPRIPAVFKESDSAGIAKFNLEARTYYVRGSLSTAAGFVNPEEWVVSLASGEEKVVQIVFKKFDSASLVSVSGYVRAGENLIEDAFIWAWSEKGGHADTRSGKGGSFSLRLGPQSRWHIGAGREIDGFPYKSSEATLDVASSSLSLDIVLTKASQEELAPRVSVSQPANQQIIAQVQDGAQVVVAPSSAGSSGIIQVSIQPTMEVPSQAAAKVVSTVYDVTVRDTVGSSVTSFSQAMEISIPYDEIEISKQGVAEDNLVPSYFDESSGVWVKVDNFTIDKEKNIAVLRVDHLTRFALVAAADITPPLSPSDVSVASIGSGRVKILWKNPVRDFDHAKVYRSEILGDLGRVVAVEVYGQEFIDSGMRDGSIYYHIVRAVDPAGNESTNLGQVSIRASGTSAGQISALAQGLISPLQTTKKELLRTLALGSSGEDVKTLQEILLKEGVYPRGLITGYFGALTRQAVVRFQVKYASETLHLAGLKKGSGVVGPLTRKKINELLGSQLDLSPAQTTKKELLRTLALGSSGEDVKTLQEILLKEGVYPRGLITGYFGALTRQAVVRFQEKYASDILTPTGLKKGSGVVGPATRKKINEIASR